MTKYHVSMHFERAFSDYGDMFTFIVESDKSADEVKKEIEAHHKKTGKHATSISVTKMEAAQK